jgi:putative ATP-binding cassette transporter
MTTRSGEGQDPAKAKPGRMIGAQLAMMAHVVGRSRAGRVLFWLLLGLVLVVGATAYGQIELNAWNKPFYDAIARKDLAEFGYQLGVYAIIAGGLLALNVAQTWLNQMTKLKLRQAVTDDLFAEWLAPRRAFMLARAGEVGVNPDQRIHEDARRLTELSTDLGVGLFQSALLLACFIGVLWSLSSGVAIEWRDIRFAVPGYMVWSALFYAGVASLASWRVGRPLVELNATRSARESDMRFSLVRVSENHVGVAACRGETRELDRLRVEFDRLLDILRRLVGATTRLAWITAGYGWFTIIAPIIVAAPAYFTGKLTFGGLLMAASAFTQVQQSLRWFVDNAGLIADWRAALLRVGEFRQALLDIDRIDATAARIELAPIDRGVVLDELSILLPTGRVRLSEPRLDVAPGEHVAIVGRPGSGKTTLFRAMAGLWPWGSGRIELPVQSVMFVPKHPYLPSGSLRDILAYPHLGDRFSSAECAAALRRMGLAHLVPALDEVAHWDKELTDPERQSAAFARLLLHRPLTVVVDTAIDTLGPEARRTLFDVFENELASAALVVIGGVEDTSGFYDRSLTLALAPETADSGVLKPVENVSVRGP